MKQTARFGSSQDRNGVCCTRRAQIGTFERIDGNVHTRKFDTFWFGSADALANRGELYMLLAYSEMMLGEGWCAGVPFSSEDGTTTTFGQPLTTEAMFQAAVAHFDTALSLAETNARVLNGSKIGKGRALINLGKFAEAAAAVQGVSARTANRTRPTRANA